MDNLAAAVEELAARVSALEKENAELRAERAPAPERNPVSRRNALRLGGLAAGAAAGTMLLRPTAAHATTANLQFGADNDAGVDDTSLTSSNPNQTLEVLNSGNGEALKAHTSNAADTQPTAHFVDDGFGGALFAECTSLDEDNSTPAIIGEAVNGGVVGFTDGSGAGVSGFGDAGTGPGVGAAIFTSSATNNALESVHFGKGRAVYAQILNSDSSANSVAGTTTGTGAGISGTSSKGVGGKFSGKTAQVLLSPSTASSHPTTGSAGALFVDKSHRLWYCKGGTSWKQLA
ncbi:MAG TPA: hypothetical protein VL856_12125 [Acidimicrobiia bacterium]|jgi:hypothetical protein|nr:hypothetical protein [Acidimicrobiia bacterium]